MKQLRHPFVRLFFLYWILYALLQTAYSLFHYSQGSFTLASMQVLLEIPFQFVRHLFFEITILHMIFVFAVIYCILLYERKQHTTAYFIGLLAAIGAGLFLLGPYSTEYVLYISSNVIGYIIQSWPIVSGLFATGIVFYAVAEIDTQSLLLFFGIMMILASVLSPWMHTDWEFERVPKELSGQIVDSGNVSAWNELYGISAQGDTLKCGDTIHPDICRMEIADAQENLHICLTMSSEQNQKNCVLYLISGTDASDCSLVADRTWHHECIAAAQQDIAWHNIQ